jgi:hypothetical protein
VRDTNFIVQGNSVRFEQDGVFIKDKDGGIFSIPFNEFDDNRDINIEKVLTNTYPVKTIKSLYNSIFGD